MAGKLLRALGAITLVALAVGSVSAWVLVRDRVRLTIAREIPGERDPAPLEILRADVSDLRAELAAMAEALPGQLQMLHVALAEDAEAREAGVAQRLSGLDARLERLGERAERLAEEVRSARRAREAAPAREGPQSLARAHDGAAAPPPEPGSGHHPTQTVSPEQAQPVPAPEPARRSALAFQVPARAFRFEGRQRLAVVPSLSRVGFDAKSTLHDFSGVTQRLEGELVVDLARPAERPSGRIEVEAATLDTGLAERDQGLRTLLETADHPLLRFEWAGMDAPRVDPAGQTVQGTAKGTLTLAGRARDVAMPVRVSVDASKRVVIEGELDVRLSDFGLRAPAKLGLISVEDTVRLWISLRARTLGPAGGTD